jgi:hypothetical protein
MANQPYALVNPLCLLVDKPRENLTREDLLSLHCPGPSLLVKAGTAATRIVDSFAAINITSPSMWFFENPYPIFRYFEPQNQVSPDCASNIERIF